MSRLDDLSKDAPVPTAVTVGHIPASDLPLKENAFTQVTIIQLYWFLWKWTAASFLFALPFVILRLLVLMLSKG